jgi:hypothetical protein
VQSGYFRLHATRPQTIGYALADSAAGQALWIYEKFQAWTDNRGDPEDALSIDAMLDDISLYWFTNTAASSARIYWENTQSGRASLSAGRIELPMAASIFPREIFCPPKEWAEALWPNLFYWNELDKGGHFAAFEQPQLFAGEMHRVASRRGAEGLPSPQASSTGNGIRAAGIVQRESCEKAISDYDRDPPQTQSSRSVRRRDAKTTRGDRRTVDRRLRLHRS